jgi:ABC-2 type transport system ATP-binding protein
MNPPAVEIQHVWKRYTGHVAVRDLSLTVPRGSVYGLLGPNGAGKTTTIRMLLNIIAPDEGSIRILGEPPSKAGITDRVGASGVEDGMSGHG